MVLNMSTKNNKRKTKNDKKVNASENSNVTTNGGVFIQNVSDRIMAIYNDLQKMSNISTDARLSVLKSTKVRTKALVRILENYKNDCKCAQLKKDVENVIFSIEDMMAGGETRLFVCHSVLSKKLEFVCVAVRMYRYENENACDFCVSSYSYAKSIQTQALAAGIGTIGVGVVGCAFGALAFLGDNDGGTRVVVFGSVTAMLGFGSLTAGTAITSAAIDTKLEADMKDILEASFLKELVSRGHAVLQDGHLFITNR